MSTLINYRLRIRNATDTADAVVFTSERGGTNPYLSSEPAGDGASFDPITTESILSTYTIRIADWSIGSAQRALSSQLEDASGRQQLGFRKTYIEYQINGGGYSNVLIAGVLSLLRLVSGAEWEAQVSDPVRAQLLTQLFSPASSTNITTFLAAWPNRGCILGGPVMTPAVSGKPGSILGIQDQGGWQMRVETTGITGEYILRPVKVYGPPQWKPDEKIENIADAINSALVPFQSSYNNGAQDPWTTILDTQTRYWAWNGVTVLIDSGSGFVPWKPLQYNYTVAVDSDGFAGVTALLVSTRKGDTGIKVKSDGTRTLTNNAIVRVRVLTVLPTEACPIFIAAHPIDVLTQLWSAANIAYDSTATAALKNAIGTDAFIALRITSSQDLAGMVVTVCRPFGIGIRVNASGQLQPFQGRMMGNTPPVAVITNADVVKGSTRLPFELDPSAAVQTIVFRQKRFSDQRTAPVGEKNSVVDGIVVSDDELTLINGDTTAIPYGQSELTTDGMLHVANATYPVIQQFITAVAQSIFDRSGHGTIALETTLLRGGAGDSVKLGDEVLVNLPELPNHNYRLGDNNAIAARAMQLVRRTETPHGYDVRFLDSGPNAQPLVTVPTVSITGSTDAPRTVALVTITNAAALNALSYGARLQWASNLTGAVPASSQFTDAMAWPAGQIPTGAIRLSPTAAGATIYVQARSEGVATSRPSNYGSTAHVTLSTVADPSGFTATPSGTDGSKCALAWTPGSGTSADLVDVWLRLSGQSLSAAVKQKTLNPGSVAYTLEGLTPSTIYIASLQYRDPRTQDLSNFVDVTFTAGGTARVLTDPIFPVGFSGDREKTFGTPVADGTYGLVVVATEVPGRVEFDEAVETGVGSGTFGSFIKVGDVPSVSGDWTAIVRVAPNDGLRRQLKARHVADGCTSSGFTTAIIVAPWTAFPLAPFGSNAQGTVTVDSNGAWQATADGPFAAQSWKYAISTSAFPTDATAAAGTVVAGRTFTTTGGPLTFGQTIYITAIPYSGTSGNGAAVGPSVHLRGAYQTFASTKTTTYPAVGWIQGSTTGPVMSRTSTPILTSPAIPVSGLVEADYVGAAVAQGASLGSIDFVCAWNSATQPLHQFVFAVLYTSGGFAFVANGTPTYPGGLQTVHVAISATPDSNTPVILQALLTGPTSGASADAAQVELREVLVTTTAPNPAVRI